MQQYRNKYAVKYKMNKEKKLKVLWIRYPDTYKKEIRFFLISFYKLKLKKGKTLIATKV